MRQNIPALQVFSFLYSASGSSVKVPLTRPQFILWLFTQRLANFNSMNCVRNISVSKRPQNVFTQMPPVTGVQGGESISGAHESDKRGMLRKKIYTHKNLLLRSPILYLLGLQ